MFLDYIKMRKSLLPAYKKTENKIKNILNFEKEIF